MNPLYVGIDVSSKSNVIYFMLPNGDKHSNFSVANSHDGSTQLVKRICSALTSESLDTVSIGLEATSVYGDNLVYFLREDASLASFHRKIHVLNPKQVNKFKESYNDLPKKERTAFHIHNLDEGIGISNQRVRQGNRCPDGSFAKHIDFYSWHWTSLLSRNPG